MILSICRAVVEAILQVRFGLAAMLERFARGICLPLEILRQRLRALPLRRCPNGALCEHAVEAGPEFLGVVFQVLHVLQEVLVVQACLCRKARRADYCKNYG